MVSTFEPFVSLRQAMDQLLEESFVGPAYRTLWSRAGVGNGWSGMPLDVYATNDQVVILAAVPGLRPEDLQITFQQGTLLLSGRIGDVASSEDTKNATWYLHELPHGQFRRSVTLPFPIEADQAQATFEHGVVRIVLPKAETAKPKTIPITVGGTTEAIGAGSAKA